MNFPYEFMHVISNFSGDHRMNKARCLTHYYHAVVVVLVLDAVDDVDVLFSVLLPLTSVINYISNGIWL